MGGNRKTGRQHRLDTWFAEVVDRVTAAVRDSVAEGGLDRSGPAPASTPAISNAQAIHEALADGLANLRKPDFDRFSAAEVAAAFDDIFSQKSGPPAPAFLAWLRERILERSGGATQLQDDAPPSPPKALLFNVYFGRLKTDTITRDFMLTRSGVEFSD
jgi:hypothetical protein